MHSSLVKLADGAELAFEITDLPAGQKAMIFEKKNQVYELDDVCEEITDTAEFEDVSPGDGRTGSLPRFRRRP